MRELIVFKGRTTCPYCKQEVKVTREPKQLDDHLNAEGLLCQGSKRRYEFISKTAALTRQKADKHSEASARFERRAERRRTRKHWRDEYSIIAEDSWGNDYLGSEGGKSSVRAYSGGRADGNDRRR